MHVAAAEIPADCLCDQWLHALANRVHGALLVHIDGYDSAFSAVHFDKAFLLQNRIRLVHRMHVDSDIIRKLADRRKHLTICKLTGRYSQNNLIAQLLIISFIAAEINLKIHKRHLRFMANVCRHKKPA